MYTHIKGATFSLISTLILKDDGVRVLDLTGYTGACEIKTKRKERIEDPDGNVMGILQFVWLDAAISKVALKATLAQQAYWPDNEDFLITDIKLISPAGEVHRTLTSQIKVVGHVTT